MKIRAGYEISCDCPQPTSMIRRTIIVIAQAAMRKLSPFRNERAIRWRGRYLGRVSSQISVKASDRLRLLDEVTLA
jgi:hypothetical protein